MDTELPFNELEKQARMQQVFNALRQDRYKRYTEEDFKRYSIFNKSQWEGLLAGFERMLKDIEGKFDELEKEKGGVGELPYILMHNERLYQNIIEAIKSLLGIL